MNGYEFLLKMIEVHPSWLVAFMLWGVLFALIGVSAFHEKKK